MGWPVLSSALESAGDKGSPDAASFHNNPSLKFQLQIESFFAFHFSFQRACASNSIKFAFSELLDDKLHQLIHP